MLYLLILIGILLFLSLAYYIKGKGERKELKFLFSILLAILLGIVVDASINNVFIYFVLPVIFFTTAQLLLYDISLTED